MEFIARERATKEHKFRGEEEVIRSLLALDTSHQQIRELCAEAFMTIDIKDGSETREVEVSAWPITAGSVLPSYLSRYAEEITEAKHDPRFPRCDVKLRPTNLWKQLWFLSRALAGAVCGISTRTALNLVGSLRPEEVFAGSRNAKPARRHRRRIMPKQTRTRK
jgi:hypothetical protein